MGLKTASALYVQETVDGKEVARPYTPTTLGDVKGHFDLVVKGYPAGKVSKALVEKRVGDEVLVKGPIHKFDYHPNQFRRVGLVAGGTGITPMFQLLQEMVWSADEHAHISLVYANRTEQDILLRDELEAIKAAAEKAGKRVDIHYVVEAAGPSWTGSKGFISPAVIAKHLPPPSPGTKIFVCGPPPMMEAISGSKAKDYSQGELKGLLARAGFTKDQVFKF